MHGQAIEHAIFIFQVGVTKFQIVKQPFGIDTFNNGITTMTWTLHLWAENNSWYYRYHILADVQ